MLPNEAYSQLLHTSSVLQHHAAMRMKTPNFSFSLKCISGPDGAKNENGTTSGPATCEIWLSGDLAMASLGSTQYKEEIDWRLRKKKIIVVMLLSNCQRVCIHLFFLPTFPKQAKQGSMSTSEICELRMPMCSIYCTTYYKQYSCELIWRNSPGSLAASVWSILMFTSPDARCTPKPRRESNPKSTQQEQSRE